MIDAVSILFADRFVARDWFLRNYRSEKQTRPSCHRFIHLLWAAMLAVALCALSTESSKFAFRS